MLGVESQGLIFFRGADKGADREADRGGPIGGAEGPRGGPIGSRGPMADIGHYVNKMLTLSYTISHYLTTNLHDCILFQPYSILFYIFQLVIIIGSWD